MNVRIFRNSRWALKAAARHDFLNFQIFGENSVAIVLAQTKVTLNKPIFVGFSVLDISKLQMYQFHYGYVKQFYGDRAALLYSDTDSLSYHIKTADVYEDMKLNSAYFDFSNYDRNHTLFDESKKQVIGYFKDEMGGKVIHRFTALAPKLYAYEYSEEPLLKFAARGFPSSTIKSNVDYAKFNEALHEFTNNPLPVTTITSKAHVLKTNTVMKAGC